MWNYYSKSSHYEGYALGIDYTKWKERVKNLNRYGYMLNIGRVLYRKKDKIDELDKIVSKYNKESLEFAKGIGKLDHIKQDLSLRIAELQFFFKDEDFSHENEVRAILEIPRDKDVSNKEAAKDKDVSNKVMTKYRAGNGYIIPYVEVSVPKEVITSVTVGPLLEKELAKKNVKEMLESRGCSCDVHTSKISIRF